MIAFSSLINDSLPLEAPRLNSEAMTYLYVYVYRFALSPRRSLQRKQVGGDTALPEGVLHNYFVSVLLLLEI